MGLRERYTLVGPDGMGDGELLALVLETGCTGRSARQIADDLLERAGGIPGLGHMPIPAMALVPGLGPARAVRLHAACNLGRRLLNTSTPPTVSRAAEALEYFHPRMADLEQEELHALFLNRRNGVLAYRVLTRGNDAHTIVDPRQVYRQALLSGACSVIVAHNHPSGDPTPSNADVEVTARLSEAGRILSVELLDHLVVAGMRYRSLREEGLFMPPGKNSTAILATPWSG